MGEPLSAVKRTRLQDGSPQELAAHSPDGESPEEALPHTTRSQRRSLPRFPGILGTRQITGGAAAGPPRWVWGGGLRRTLLAASHARGALQFGERSRHVLRETDAS